MAISLDSGNPHNIFKKTVCDICGKVEWKPYAGGHEFFLDRFEESSYTHVAIKGRSLTVCPKCGDEIYDSIQNLIDFKKTRCLKP